MADENARRVKQQLSDQAAVLVKEKEKEPGAQPGHRDAHGHTVKISEKALRLKAEEEARQKEADELNGLLDEKLVRCRLNTEPTVGCTQRWPDGQRRMSLGSVFRTAWLPIAGWTAHPSL